MADEDDDEKTFTFRFKLDKPLDLPEFGKVDGDFVVVRQQPPGGDNDAFFKWLESMAGFDTVALQRTDTESPGITEVPLTFVRMEVYDDVVYEPLHPERRKEMMEKWFANDLRPEPANENDEEEPVNPAHRICAMCPHNRADHLGANEDGQLIKCLEPGCPCPGWVVKRRRY